MATTSRYDDGAARHRLTDLVLRLPRALRRTEDPRWQQLSVELPSVFPQTGIGPIVGTASTGREDETALLLARGDDALGVGLGLIAELIDHPGPIGVLVVGPFVAASRPAEGGNSVSGDAVGGDTGTICCLVEDTDGDRFILGCNHTLAAVNRAIVSRDTVRAPGAAAGGMDPGDRFGPLTNYATIQLGGYHRNTLDAAIAEPTESSAANPGVRGIGPIKGTAHTLRHGDRVKKMGWATNFTAGTVFATIDFTVNLAGQPALFVDQLGIVGDDQRAGFAQRGDSGAPVLTEVNDELGGMVIAVAPNANLSIATPIDPILEHFGISPCLH